MVEMVLWVAYSFQEPEEIYRVYMYIEDLRNNVKVCLQTLAKSKHLYTFIVDINN